MDKENITVRLDAETLRKAEIVAAERSTSVSRLLADEIERLVAEHDRYGGPWRRRLPSCAAGTTLEEVGSPAGTRSTIGDDVR